jgi:hypothetical protein
MESPDSNPYDSRPTRQPEGLDALRRNPGILAAAAVLVGGVILVSVWRALRPAPKLADDLMYLPDECDQIVTLHPCLLDKSKVIEAVRSARPELLTYQHPFFGISLPVDLAAFERTTSGRRTKDGASVGVSRMMRPIREADLAPAIFSRRPVANYEVLLIANQMA